MAKNKLTLLSAFLLFLLPVAVLAASLAVSPSSGTYEVGSRVTARILVSAPQSINAISGTVVFPTSQFTIESVSKTGSVLNFWVTEPSFSTGSGAVHFEGVALGGYQGQSGTVLTVVLRALKPGTGKVNFVTAQVLANDGQGTDATGGYSGANLAVIAAKVKPKPVEEKPAPVVEEPQPVVEEPQKPVLTAPEIMLGNKYGAQAVTGTSQYPKAQVLLTFTALEGSKIYIIGTSDNDGGFTIVVPASVRHGAYKVNAIIVTEDGNRSLVSDDIIVNLGNVFSDIGPEVWVLIGLLFLAVLYLVVRLIIHFVKRKKGTENLTRDVHQAEDKIRESFTLFRKEMENSIQGGKNITEIKKDFEDVEDVLNKEMKEIEKDIDK